MTTIAIFSDLHLEHGKFVPSQTALDSDIVILAGDIGSKHYGLRWAAETFTRSQILYVMGNHEAYGERRDITISYLRKEAKKPEYNGRVHFLNNDQLVIDGIRFLGTTLWTNFCLYGDDTQQRAMEFAGRRMNDYFKIQRAAKPDGEPYKNLLTPNDTLHSHKTSVAWLEDHLYEDFSGATVVITHHAPSRRSLLNNHDEGLLSAAYASNLDYLVKHATAWVHGHIHASLTYKIGDATIICNPRGYVKHEVNLDFKEDFVIEIIGEGKLKQIELDLRTVKMWLDDLDDVRVYDEDCVDFILAEEIPHQFVENFREFQMSAQRPVVRGNRELEAHYARDYRHWLEKLKKEYCIK